MECYFLVDSNAKVKVYADVESIPKARDAVWDNAPIVKESNHIIVDYDT